MTNKQMVASIDFGGAVRPQVHKLLRDRIIRCELEPGVRISEAEIAAEYRVSRQPIREAFIKLSEEGLVEVRPQRGTFVSKIITSSVYGAQFVRSSLEAEMAKSLAEKANVSLVKHLREMIQKQSEAIRSNPVSFVELDELFHQTIAEASGQSYAWGVIESVKPQMDRVRFLSTRKKPLNLLVAQHADIVDAIDKKDPVLAVKAVKTHLNEILVDLPVISEEMPEFFES